MELLDVYDKDGKKKGITVFRGEYIRPDDYILVVHVYLYNDNNEFLIQRRSRKKKVNSGKWDITGGAVKAGEESIDAAIRETKEEIGLEVKKEDLRLIARYESIKHLVDIYFAKMDLDLKTCCLQEDEVSEVKLIQGEKLMDSFKNSDFQDPKYNSIVRDELIRIIGKDA